MPYSCTLTLSKALIILMKLGPLIFLLRILSKGVIIVVKNQKTFDVTFYSPSKSFASFSDVSKSGVATTSRSKTVRVVKKIGSYII